MRYLNFELSDGGDAGGATLEAIASTSAERHADVMDEVARIVEWAQRHFPGARGALDDGMEWDLDLQSHADGEWHTVALTLAGTQRFVDAFVDAFPDALLQA